MPDEEVPEPKTITVPQLAELLGVSSWALYESIRRGDCPVPAIRIGKRIVFSQARVKQLLGSDRDGAAS